MKTLTLLALLFLAGCGDTVNVDKEPIVNSISKPQNSFLFTQEYGYSDTVGESLVLGDYLLPYIEESYVTWITTGDTVLNGLYKRNFKLYYSTQNHVTIDFGNGISKSYYGNGIDAVKYICNTNYEVIITNK